MPQTVYIDVLFFVNFILDAMIFLSAATLLRQRIRWWRTCVAAAVGALCSCGMFFSAIAPWLINVLALLLYILCAYIVFGFHGVKPFVKNSLITVVCAFVYGGVAFALYLYTGAGAVMTFNNGALYIDIPVFTLLLFAFVAYGAIWLVGRILKWLAPKESFAQVTLRFGEQTLCGRALIDTGNALRDGVTGAPVILCSYRFAAKILPPGLRAFVRDTHQTDIDLVEEQWRSRLRMVSYSSVGGSGMLPALRADRVQIEYHGRHITAEPALVAITAADLSGQGDCELLLAPQHVE